MRSASVIFNDLWPGDERRWDQNLLHLAWIRSLEGGDGAYFGPLGVKKSTNLPLSMQEGLHVYVYLPQYYLVLFIHLFVYFFWQRHDETGRRGPCWIQIPSDKHHPAKSRPMWLPYSVWIIPLQVWMNSVGMLSAPVGMDSKLAKKENARPAQSAGGYSFSLAVLNSPLSDNPKETPFGGQASSCAWCG